MKFYWTRTGLSPATVRKLLILFLALGGTLAQATELWVAPSGNDDNPGTRELPLATPASALRKGRELRRLKDPSVNDGVRIILRDGQYALTEPLFIRPEDSGTPTSPTVFAAAAGEKPVLSGGVGIAGWKKISGDVSGLPVIARGQVWVADLPQFNGRPLEFRQLWVDGHKAVRARTPNNGTMERLAAWDRAKREAWIPATIALPAKLDGVEMEVLQMWEIAVLRLKFSGIEGDRVRVNFHEPEDRIEFEHPWPQPVIDGSHGNSPFFFANALEFLDTPGEWFEDTKAGVVYYWPRAGNDLAHAEAVAPALETLVEISGTPDRPVAHVTFDGVGFAYSTWLRPSISGHVPLQAGFFLIDAYGLKPKGTPDWRSLDNQAWVGRPAAAVTVTGAQDVNFNRCRFEHTAASGLDFVEAVQDSAVEGCRFNDIGINGLVAGEFAGGGFESHLPWNPADERMICARLKFTNNLLTDCATEDWGGVALIAGIVRDTTVAHNEIDGTSYTGISLGWSWTRTANASRGNLIHANLIQNFATRMSDTGGIYTLSAQPGTVVSENAVMRPTISPYVHDPEHWYYLYTDEGSSFITVRDNWCPEARFMKNSNGPGNQWENNGPQVAEKIKLAAGLTPEFRDLLGK
ncbi:MAG TPA: right-handed parallel beta-helix repeat-containing protein [Lacunisphaera sp.]